MLNALLFRGDGECAAERRTVEEQAAWSRHLAGQGDVAIGVGAEGCIREVAVIVPLAVLPVESTRKPAIGAEGGVERDWVGQRAERSRCVNTSLVRGGFADGNGPVPYGVFEIAPPICSGCQWQNS